MASLKSTLRFYMVRSLYALVDCVRAPFHRLHDRMMENKFGVPGIQIGPGAILRGVSAIQMGEGFSAGPGLWLEAIHRYKDQTFAPRIILGRNVVISTWGHIAATHYVEIGNEVLIGSRVIITDHNHGQYSGTHSSPDLPPRFRTLDSDKEVIIGRNVWLGDGVVVTPGARIGEGSVIGANSVVTGTIPPFTLAAGVPARPLKRYDFAVKQWVAVR